MKLLNLLWIVVLILIPIVYSGGTGDLGNEKAKVKYTFDSKEICIGKQCTLTIGGQEYADDNGTLLEKAKSLKTCQFCNNVKLNLQEDKTNFPVRVLDYNYSKRKICYSVGISKTGIEIPLTIYNKYNKSQISLSTSLNLFSVFNEQCIELEANIDEVIKWGDASTTISLNITNRAIINDTMINQFSPTTYYAGSEILSIQNYSGSTKHIIETFNISLIPDNAIITHANLSLFGFTIYNSLDAGESLNITVYGRQLNTSISPFKINWNQKPNLNELFIAGGSKIVVSGEGNKYSYWNVLNIFNNYNLSNKNLTFYFKAVVYSGTLGSTDRVDYESIESTLGGHKHSYINITYELQSVLSPIETNCSYNGTGNKMFRCNCVINKSINFLNKNVTINGSGRFVIKSNFTNFKNFWIGTKPTDKCNLSIENGGKLL